MAADWFRREISVGLARLLALGLPGAPIDEAATKACREVWIDAMWLGRAWDERLDATRLREGFRLLAVRVERWPAPKHLLDALPARIEPLALDAPRPAVTDEQRAKLRAILAGLRDAMKVRS